MLAGSGLGLISLAFSGEPHIEVVTGNGPVNAGATVPNDITAHNSPSLARNPRRPQELVVVNRVDTPRFACAMHVSRDGGASWKPARLPEPPGRGTRCYAPDVAYGADGTLYVSFVTLAGPGNEPRAAWLTRSDDGARTLADPEQILGPLVFQVRIAAHPTTPGSLHVTWLQAEEVALFRFPQTGNPIMTKHTDDGGSTWSGPTPVSRPGRARVVAATPVVDRRDMVHVLYLDLGDDRLDYEGGHEGEGGEPYPGPWQLILARSSGGDGAWRETVVEDGVVPTERFLAFIPPFPALAVGDAGREVHVAFQDGRLGDPDVLLWTSTDGGAGFGEPTRVNDTRWEDGTSQYLPRLAMAPDGRLDAIYYDRRQDARNVMTEVSLQSSFDGGRTFLPRVNLTDRPFDSRIGFGSERGLPDLGSRLALVSTAAAALAVWTDTRAGTVASNKQDLARAIVAVARPQRLSEPLRHGLRWGGLALLLGGIGLLWRGRRT